MSGFLILLTWKNIHNIMSAEKQDREQTQYNRNFVKKYNLHTYTPHKGFNKVLILVNIYRVSISS